MTLAALRGVKGPLERAGSSIIRSLGATNLCPIVVALSEQTHPTAPDSRRSFNDRTMTIRVRLITPAVCRLAGLTSRHHLMVDDVVPLMLAAEVEHTYSA
jgi:hypothetical protein